MADLVVTLGPNKSEIGLMNPQDSLIIPGLVFDPTLLYVGKMMVLDPTTRRWTLASAGAAGTSINSVVALCTSQRDRGISLMKRGWVGNKEIALGAAAAGDRLYLSNTAGAIGTTAGTSSLVVGRVVPGTDGYGPDLSLFIYLDVPWQ